MFVEGWDEPDSRSVNPVNYGTDISYKYALPYLFVLLQYIFLASASVASSCLLSFGTSPCAPVHSCCSVRARHIRGCPPALLLGPLPLTSRRVHCCPSRSAATSERERARWERRTVRNAVQQGGARSAFSRERAEPESCNNILTLECPHPWVLEPSTGKSRMEWFHPISSHEPNTSYMFIPHQL